LLLLARLGEQLNATQCCEIINIIPALKQPARREQIYSFVLAAARCVIAASLKMAMKLIVTRKQQQVGPALVSCSLPLPLARRKPAKPPLLSNCLRF